MLLPAFPLGTEHTKELCFRRESQVLGSEPFLSGLFSIWKIFFVWIITGHVVFQPSSFSSYYFYKLIGFMRYLHPPCMLFWSCSSIFRCLPLILHHSQSLAILCLLKLNQFLFISLFPYVDENMWHLSLSGVFCFIHLAAGDRNYYFFHG